ncbi:hypothetical protein D3C86_2099610 [compost metagenome]
MPGAGELHARVFAHNQFDAKVRFDIVDNFADCWLRKTELTGGRTNGSTFNDFLKYNEVLRFR